MQRPSRAQWCKRITASLVLVTYAAGCTHMPSGEKAFNSFDSCFASNLGLAAIGGIGVGVLSAKLTRGAGSSTSAAIGATAGIATATMIAMTAWRKCAAVYNTSEPVAKAATAQQPLPANRQRQLNLDRLEVRVEGSENDPPIPEFDFTYYADDAAAKDIKARFRHKVEIVRFTPDANDKLVLADAKGEPMRDGSGNTIPLEMANKMPRDRLQWVTIAEEGKDDYVEDVVIQQGARTSYRHKLQIPPRDQMPLPLPVPMRYTLTVEADRLSSKRTVDFALLPASERPKRFTAAAAMNAGAAAGSATRSLAPNASGTATHATKRKATLYSSSGAGRKVAGSLPKGAKVNVEERAEVSQKGKPVSWVKVVSETGKGGWLAESELVENK
ncbi:MAG TPA: SH3 domain-containing protein [Noviherbaspirillum sp.]|jgi:hypothetical protein|uniref:SH3 domain-containing protein n=1 Tax=Noviherbaspirillum sp. TaxID=1926288 RepID=UPI002F942CA6